MYRSPFLLILSILLASCSSAKPGVITIMDENVHPKLIWKGQNMDGKIIEEFQALFLKATNHKIELTSDENNESLISLKIDKTQTDQFKICYKNKLLQIEGSNEKALRQGVNYFFLNYLSYYPFKNTDTHQKVLAIPSDLEYTQKVSFEYREPYFRQNYEAELFHFNQTNQLEETWGIWGQPISFASLANLLKKKLLKSLSQKVKRTKT